MPARIRLLRLALALGAWLAPAACGAQQPATPVVPATATPLLYVANQGGASVSIIDMTANAVVATVDLTALGFSPNAKPHHIAVEPDGSFWYVTLIGDGKVLKFDRSNRLVGQADMETPGLLALDAHSDRLFVGRSMTAVNPPARLGVIRRSDMHIEETDIFLARPHALTLSADGRYAIVSSMTENQVAALEAADDQVDLTPLAGPPHALVQFARSPDGTTLVAGGHLSGQLVFFDTSRLPVVRAIATVSIGGQPFDPVFTPDGRWVFISNLAANTVTVVDAASHTVAAVLADSAFAQPNGIAVRPDGRYIYISNRNTGDSSHAGHQSTAPSSAPGRIVVIDVATRRVVQVLDVGPYAAGLGVATPR